MDFVHHQSTVAFSLDNRNQNHLKCLNVSSIDRPSGCNLKLNCILHIYIYDCNYNVYNVYTFTSGHLVFCNLALTKNTSFRSFWRKIWSSKTATGINVAMTFMQGVTGIVSKFNLFGRETNVEINLWDSWTQMNTSFNKNVMLKDIWLVVSTHLKNISQNGNLPQIGVKIKKYLKPPPRYPQVFQHTESISSQFVYFRLVLSHSILVDWMTSTFHPKILLMEEIPNNHLGCITPCK